MVELIPPEFKCPVCLGWFITPATLLCGHTFCFKCVNNKNNKNKNNRKRIQCPICRDLRGYSKPLSTNYTILHLLQKYPKYMEYLKDANHDSLVKEKISVVYHKMYSEYRNNIKKKIYWTYKSDILTELDTLTLFYMLKVKKFVCFGDPKKDLFIIIKKGASVNRLKKISKQYPDGVINYLHNEYTPLTKHEQIVDLLEDRDLSKLIDLIGIAEIKIEEYREKQLRGDSVEESDSDEETSSVEESDSYEETNSVEESDSYDYSSSDEESDSDSSEESSE